MKRLLLVMLMVFGGVSVSMADDTTSATSNGASAQSESAPQMRNPNLKPAPPIKWQRSSQCGAKQGGSGK